MTLKRRRSLRTHCVTGRVRDFEPVRAGLGGTRACVSQSRWSRRQTFHDSAKSHSILGKLLGMIAIGGLSDSIVVRAALPACHVLSPATCGRCHGAVTVVSVCQWPGTRRRSCCCCWQWPGTRRRSRMLLLLASQLPLAFRKRRRRQFGTHTLTRLFSTACNFTCLYYCCVLLQQHRLL